MVTSIVLTLTCFCLTFVPYICDGAILCPSDIYSILTVTTVIEFFPWLPKYFFPLPRYTIQHKYIKVVHILVIYNALVIILFNWANYHIISYK